MKNSIKYILTLICAVIATACAHDESSQSPESGTTTTVNFVLTTDNDNAPQTRAISDGKSVDVLYYAILSESGEVVIPKSTKHNATSLASAAGLSMHITLPYGKKFKAVFWAQNSESQAYTVSDDMVVSVDYGVECNDDRNDAFYGVSDIFVTSDGMVEVTLQRPFAQLNVGAFPFEHEYLKEYCDFDITKSCIRVRDVAHTMNLITGELSDMGSASFKPGAIPTEALKANITGEGDTEYTYVAMAYLLADTTPSTHTAEFFFLNDENKVVMFERESANTVELQRNYRTDYLGQVLSDYGEVNIRTYDDAGNTSEGNVYYNVSEPTTISNTVYNMSDHSTALQFASVDGQTITYDNLLFTGDIWTIELGEYRGANYVNYTNVLNNVELRNLSVSSLICCHEWYFSPATIAYGNTIFNNCTMKGATSIHKTATDEKTGEVYEVIPVDVGVRNESDAVFNGGEYGTMFAWTHSVVEVYDADIDTLYCGTCDSTDHSWMTIGKGTTIDRVICCEPRCPYGATEYSTTMTIKMGAKVGSLQLVSTDVEFLIIEDGADVGTITCEGITYTYEELRAAMGL